MTKRELLRSVREFRRGILDGGTSDNMCFMVCVPLVGFLSAFGVEADLQEGEVMGCHHYWLTLSDGRIIDPTADQFPHIARLPAVYVGPQPDHYVPYSVDETNA